MEEDEPQTAADIERILVEIVLGLMWGDPRSKVAPTEQNALVWAKVAAEVDEMERKGIAVEVPFELPLPDDL